ncbi:MAG: hypothetical protein KA715_02355 [Xanthomonadaceae bacterium]|nr:hypothetical protein [Xanthomonadaceae bacterium]
MGKKKKQEIEIEERLEFIANELRDAITWIEESTPFEVLSELARLGVKTHNWNEVVKFYDDWQPRKVNKEFIPASSELADVWMSEIKAKNGNEQM